MPSVNDWISAEFQRLAEILSDYDPYLALEMIPFEQHEHLNDKSKVFRVVDTRNNTVVLHADSLANPADILARVWDNDSKHGNVLMRMDTKNAAIKALELKKQIDEKEAIQDFVAFIAKNTKSRWEHEGKIYDDEFRSLGPKSTVID